ncbi:MAG: arginine--tRNA ligase, partial [Candidatus Krumholzibacteria bacterium]|nr:arginine--tRNA ligase [Candidatus Krumholzibacteria bacterium]
ELDSAMVSQWQSLPEEECHAAFAGWAIVRIGEQIRTQMEGFRSPFDVWFSERTLHEGGHLDSARDFLVSQKLCYEEEGALWFRSSDFGDDKDRVIQRSDGTPTYFLADVAYAIDKRDRGFSKAIYVLGPDHHGYVARLKAIAEAIGKGSDWIEVILLQWVTLMEGGEAVSMSKRAGEFVTMEDLIREVGVDVARCYFLTRRAESHLDFDLDLAREQSSKSPVFYAQYATARISGLLRKAAEAGFSGEEEVELQRLNCEEELALIRALERFPEILASSAEAREPNRLFSYLSDVSTLFHRFYHEHQIVSEDRELSVARLALSRASRQVLANGLSLMGVDAPERM